ncbi:hypothetical protein H7H80_12285, partial [Mycobacterium interjectum]|nr:hypothetical protein [Mycobacterium interjectum]
GVRFAVSAAPPKSPSTQPFRVAGDLPEHWTAVPYGKPFPNIACRVVATAARTARLGGR